MRLIDADALIAEWCDGCKYLSNGICDQDICGGALLMKEAPTIDPESLRPQGEWIYHIDDLFPAEGTQECSNCHQEEKISLCNENYCPNCGAKMTTKKGDADD